MNLSIILLLTCCIINTDTSFAFAISKPGGDRPGITNVLNNMKASEFVKLSAKDFGIITGKKMNMWNRVSFSVLKMRIKHYLKKNPNLSINDYAKKSSRRSHAWIWISIGLAILLIVLIIAGLSVAGPYG